MPFFSDHNTQLSKHSLTFDTGIIYILVTVLQYTHRSSSVESLTNMETLDEVTPTRLASHKAPPVEYLHLSDRTIAYRHLEGKCPTLIYVGGFLSTMEIHKATTIEQYAKVQGRASIRYDQASVGLSQGITRENAYNEIWVQDCLAMMDIVAAKGEEVLQLLNCLGYIITN